MQNFGGQRFLHIILTMYTLSSKLIILMACNINNFMPLAPGHSTAFRMGLLEDGTSCLPQYCKLDVPAQLQGLWLTIPADLETWLLWIHIGFPNPVAVANASD